MITIKKETRGAKKGRVITWNTRPDIEKAKDVNMSFRTTIEERENIKKLLKEIDGNNISEKIQKGLEMLRDSQK